jgi:hypothetical protein
MKTSKSRNNVSRQEILDYWKDRIEINTSWDDALTHCWACGSHTSRRLERSHIIPHCLNGIGHCSNMVLLCALCNEQCPETIFGYDFMLWLKSRVNKEKYYFIEPDDNMGLFKEYENIYEEEMLPPSFEKLFGAYFGTKRIADTFNRYLEKINGKQAFMRYASTRAIMFDKYVIIIRAALDYILRKEIDSKDKKNILRIFYKFLKLEPEKEAGEEIDLIISSLPQLPTLSIFQEIVPIEEELVYGPPNKC